MGIYLIWFVIAMIVIFIEMNLMSFYLIAVAIGCIAGGAAAYFENPLDIQFTYAGIAIIISACLAHFLRRSLKKHQDKSNNNLDHGQRVTIEESNINKDGTANVNYRGASWVAYMENKTLTPGVYTIDKIVGTKLLLSGKLEEMEA